jgi:hypothetical protein
MLESLSPFVEYLDDVVSQETHDLVCSKLDQIPWHFGHGSVAEQARPFWKMILDQDVATDRIWAEAKATCEAIAGGELIVLRQYANGHTYGQGGMSHTDDDRAGSYTLLYYPMREWQQNWAGETVFYGADCQVTHCVTPKPRRAIMFDARVPHAGLAPSEEYNGLRKTIAFKLVLKSIFDAQELVRFKLDRLICEPFDREAQMASGLALKEALLEQLAQSFTGDIHSDHLQHEKQRIRESLQRAGVANGQTIESLDEDEIHEVALQRLKSGMAILAHAQSLRFESGAPLTEQRTLEALLRRAIISNKMVGREELLAL